MANLSRLHRQPRDTGQFCGAAILPEGSQGATLGSLTCSSSSPSGALQLVGEPGLAFCSWGRPALTAVIPQGASAGHAAWDCVSPASLGGSLVSIVESVGRCFQTFEVTREGIFWNRRSIFLLSAPWQSC